MCKRMWHCRNTALPLRFATSNGRAEMPVAIWPHSSGSDGQLWSGGPQQSGMGMGPGFVHQTLVGIVRDVSCVRVVRVKFTSS